VTLHQGAIEAIFLDSMKEMDVEVDRPVRPTSIAISEDKDEHEGHPVRVCLNFDPSAIDAYKDTAGDIGTSRWERHGRR